MKAGMKATLRAGCLIGLPLLAACNGGGRTASAGPERQQTATYRLRVLTSDLPPQVRVPSIAAAAEATLRHRGYSVTSTATEDYMRVEGEAPNAGWGERVVIRARQTPGKTRVEITAQPLGDQVLSRAVLDELLASLGM